MLESTIEGDGQYVKSRFSGGGNCVEVCLLPDKRVAVRHSREPGQVLHFSMPEWTAFVAGVKVGTFDLTPED